MTATGACVYIGRAVQYRCTSHQATVHIFTVYASGRNGRALGDPPRQQAHTNKRAVPNLDAIQSSGPGTWISSTWIHLVDSWSDVTGRTPPTPTATCHAAVFSAKPPTLPAYPPTSTHLPTRPPEGTPPKLAGVHQAWIPGGRLAPLCLAMPPCRDLCNVGIGIDYGDCVVAAGPEVSRGRGCLPVYTYTFTYCTMDRIAILDVPQCSTIPLCFETNSEAAVRAPTSGMPDGGCGWLPSCPSTHTSSRRPCRSPPTSAKTVANGEATTVGQ